MEGQWAGSKDSSSIELAVKSWSTDRVASIWEDVVVVLYGGAKNVLVFSMKIGVAGLSG